MGAWNTMPPWIGEVDMRKITLGVGIAVMILAGLALAFYPSVSNWLAQRDQFSAIQEYSTALADMSAQEMEDERKKAREYNNTLTGAVIVDPFVPGTGMVLPENYMSILNVKGIMGHIEIPKIDVYLPIYHSTEESVLKKGVGHLENTALPIGGEGNHAVLTGHCGLSSARLFTDLEKLEIGDIYYLHVLDETLAYRTDQILIVEPDDTSNLHPAQGEDYVTLITCTPYGINTHRLLVRGTRVPYTPEEIPEPLAPQLAADDPTEYGLWILIALSVVSILIVIEIHSLTNRLRSRRKGEKKKKTRFSIRGIVLFLMIAGMAVISFPYISQMLYKNQAATVIAAFDERAEALADDERGHLDWLYEWMTAYNKELYENKQNGLVDPFSYQQAPEFLMDLNLEDEMIGYLSIPKMNSDLPI